ncbi:MAG: hypothetical protein ACXWMB_06680, partial [Candidatus Limnocylindria bacterium]
MLQSLRARLAFLFTGTLVLATVIASVVVISLYQSYNRDQTEAELRKQVVGVARYYERAAFAGAKPGRAPRQVTKSTFEQASDAKLYYVGPPLFPNLRQTKNLRNAGINLNYAKLHHDSRPVYEFKPPGLTITYIGVGAPIFLGDQPVGAVILAKPLADVNNAWKNVIGLVAAGVAVGLI